MRHYYIVAINVDGAFLLTGWTEHYGPVMVPYKGKRSENQIAYIHVEDIGDTTQQLVELGYHAVNIYSHKH